MKITDKTPREHRTFVIEANYDELLALSGAMNFLLEHNPPVGFLFKRNIQIALDEALVK